MIREVLGNWKRHDASEGGRSFERRALQGDRRDAGAREYSCQKIPR